MRTATIPALLLAAILAEGIITAVCALTRYATFKSSGYDIGDFVQIQHNLLHGHGLTTTIAPPFVAQSWLAIHFSPILYALAPLYALFPYAQTLLLLHPFVIAAAAWPLYHAVRRTGCTNAQSLVFALLYLVNPFVLNAAVWDFHEIAFAPFFIAWALWALLAARRSIFIITCVLLLATKEHYGLAVFGLGTLWAIHHKDRRFGFSVAVAGFMAFVLVIAVVMPALSPLNQHFMLTHGDNPHNRFGWLISSTPLSHGMLALWFLDQSITYAFLLLVSWLFLPLLAPLWLLPALADGLANGLSLNIIMRLPWSYHGAALIPILAVAAARALVIRFPRGSQTRNSLLWKVAVASTALGYLQAPLPLPGTVNAWELRRPILAMPEEDRLALSDIAKLIPDDAAVAAQNNVAAHLAARSELYEFPPGLGQARWIVLRPAYPFRHSAAFGAAYSVPPEQYFAAVRELLDDSNWAVAYWNHGWLVMAKGKPDAAAPPHLREAARKAVMEAQACYASTLDKTNRGASCAPL